MRFVRFDRNQVLALGRAVLAHALTVEVPEAMLARNVEQVP